MKKEQRKEAFIKFCLEKFGDQFDYSKVDYQNNRKPVEIICKDHGSFFCLTQHFIRSKYGCRQCAIEALRKNTEPKRPKASKEPKQKKEKIKKASTSSKKEPAPIVEPVSNPESYNNFINYIKSVYNGRIIENDKELAAPYTIAIHIPDKKIAFEFDSLSGHSERNGFTKRYHLTETNKCEEKGVRLIHVFEDEWELKPQIVKARIRHLLGITSGKIYARKCKVRELTYQQVKPFILKYHIQGTYASSINLGLFYKNRMVAVMTFNKSRFNKKYDYELIRYCTVANFTVIGGASKLFEYFRRNNAGSVITYADRRWSQGQLYRQIGFKEIHDADPNYFYFKDNSLQRKSRVQFQKHKLPRLLNYFDLKLSEYENMSANGWDRIWDVGNKVFIAE